jgi:hypothetical protein
MMKICCLILLFLVLYSCNKDPYDLDFKIDSAPTVLCMSGFVSPDSIYIILTRNLPRDRVWVSNQEFFIKDSTAIINVFEDDQFFCRLQPMTVLTKDWYSGTFQKTYYISHKKVTEGKTYTITASHKDYESIRAKTTMPYNVPVISVDTFTFNKHEKIWHVIDGDVMNAIITDTIIQYTMFTINFQDPPQYMNYYMVEILNKYGGRDDNLQDPIIETKPKLYSQNPGLNLFTDKFIQGKKYGFQYSVRSVHSDSLLFRLFSLNEDYYKYNLSVYKFNSKTYDTYQEPTPIYSNIQNGIGIIGGFSESVVKLEYFK